MVHLIEFLKSEKEKIIYQQNIQSAFFSYIYKKGINFSLSGIEELALKGYKGKKLSQKEIDFLLNNKSQKNKIDNNIYKLIGLYLGSINSNEIVNLLIKKFQNSSHENQYLLYRTLPNIFNDTHKETLKKGNNLFIQYLLDNEIEQEQINTKLKNLTNTNISVPELIILDDFFNKVIEIKYTNFSALEMIKQILENFPEGIKKITKRRKGKQVFTFKDEYDVQDVLYTILKPLFPKMKEEDPIPKHGSTSTRIDLIFREQGILLEVKMIKESDKNEDKFITQLKEDIQSYHVCQWMKHLICFVYDPLNKTKDINSFYDLNGNQTINEKTFDVEVIVVK